MPTPKTMDNEDLKKMIDEFVRDMCCVHPIPKSKARRRIEEILAKKDAQMLEIIESVPTFADECSLCDAPNEHKEVEKAHLKGWKQQQRALINNPPPIKK